MRTLYWLLACMFAWVVLSACAIAASLIVLMEGRMLASLLLTGISLIASYRGLAVAETFARKHAEVHKKK